MKFGIGQVGFSTVLSHDLLIWLQYPLKHPWEHIDPTYQVNFGLPLQCSLRQSFKLATENLSFPLPFKTQKLKKKFGGWGLFLVQYELRKKRAIWH